MQKIFDFLGYNKEDAKKAATDAEIKLAVDVTSKGIQHFIFGAITFTFVGCATLLYSILINPSDDKNTLIKVVTVICVCIIFMTVFTVIIALLGFSTKKRIQQLNELYISGYKQFEQNTKQYSEDNRSINKKLDDNFAILNDAIKNIDASGNNMNTNPKGCIILSKTITHTIISKKAFQHSRFFKIRCISEKGISIWSNRYWWSGDKVTSFKSLTPGVEIANNKPINNRYGIKFNIFDVIFLQPLKQNDEIEFKLNWDLSDKNLQSQHLVGTTIAEQTQLFTIILYIPPGMRIKVHKEETFLTDIIYSELIPYNEQNRYIWEIENPKIGNAYSICWTYE